MIMEGLDTIFHNPTSSFLTGSFMDIFFDGIPVDCSSDIFASEAICARLVNDGGLPKINDTHVAFSLFGRVGTPGYFYLIFFKMTFF